MGKNKLYLLFLIIGVTAGVSFGLIKARASIPNESSGGEVPASVYYDEMWNATSAVISTKDGYSDFNPSAHSSTQTAASFDNDNNIEIFPKFVVKEWTVHGHIHFE